MDEWTAPQPGADLPMDLLLAAEVQDDVLVAGNDLERLDDLLTHACEELQASFHAAFAHLDVLPLAAGANAGLRADLTRAVTALQFQDLAAQLIAHTRARLRGTADRLALAVLAEDDDGPAPPPEPLRPSPVAQTHVAGGSVELF